MCCEVINSTKEYLLKSIFVFNCLQIMCARIILYCSECTRITVMRADFSNISLGGGGGRGGEGGMPPDPPGLGVLSCSWGPLGPYEHTLSRYTTTCMYHI